jgi:hypothetical protein
MMLSVDGFLDPVVSTFYHCETGVVLGPGLGLWA